MRLFSARIDVKMGMIIHAEETGDFLYGKSRMDK